MSKGFIGRPYYKQGKKMNITIFAYIGIQTGISVVVIAELYA